MLQKKRVLYLKEAHWERFSKAPLGIMIINLKKKLKEELKKDNWLPVPDDCRGAKEKKNENFCISVTKKKSFYFLLCTAKNACIISCLTLWGKIPLKFAMSIKIEEL